jgi:predicted  nucleic acid-binding Zn-ribbon protein|nr:MAG TPA: SlyX-like protein [Caudoviricetes sp.]DAL89836.1 MAG TPA: SlyX-like protein [Caudoviricetes sp.]DAT09453.1 MAG TPA: SlyX-like protein [Caudoviricetes sp.]DAX88726.1 MAG TPA: SlyX-like protein [Caudoviricetes sp.]
MNKKQIALFIVLIIAIIAQSIYIVTLTQRVDNLSNAVSNISFNNDSDKLSKRIDEIESKIASFSDDLHSLSNNIDDNTAEIVSIKRQLSDVVYKINSLISDINLYILSR